MQYKFAKEQPDYSDLASGRVFYSLPGHPAFPVRLASEVFQRCLAHREDAGAQLRDRRRHHGLGRAAEFATARTL